MATAREPATLKPFVEMLKVGDGIGHLNLMLVPLRGEGHGQLDYILGADAIVAGQLHVTEVSEGGHVPELLVVSEADKPALLLDGEELIGAKQNRILNTSVLVPAKAQTKIPVSCVEQGRWRYASPDFTAGSYAPSKLRARKSRDVGRNLKESGQAASNQGAVWDEVAAMQFSLGAESPTMAMHDAIDQRHDSLDGYVKALSYPEDARGVFVAINGRFTAMDLFDKPATLERVWPRLLMGYAVDALVRSMGDEKPVSPKGPHAFIERLGQVPSTPCPSPGLGEDWRFEAEDVVGQALVADGVCVHLSMFPNEGLESRRDPAEQPIVPPSRRRRNRRNPPDDIVY